MILWKNPEKQRELSEITWKTRQILDTIECLARSVYGDDIVITEIMRNDPGSVHYYGRGVDIAILANGGIEGSERIRRAINLLYPYGKEGVETVPKLDHGTAHHIHIQTKEE